MSFTVINMYLATYLLYSVCLWVNYRYHRRNPDSPPAMVMFYYVSMGANISVTTFGLVLWSTLSQ